MVAGVPADEAATDERDGFAPVMDGPRFAADVPPDGVRGQGETEEAENGGAPGTAEQKCDDGFHVDG